MKDKSDSRGFTLIELSIVLVIIGLIIGGILVGQEMITQAMLRATVAQIEKYNTAVNTFKVKYGYLPGDIPDPYASSFGFKARGIYPGQGDGDGLLAGNYNNTAGGYCACGGVEGEAAMFWVDLSTAKLIDGNFTVASPNVYPADIGPTSTPYNLTAYLPVPKIGGGNYFYVWTGSGINYITLAQVNDLGWGEQSIPSLTVKQAYYLDNKYDDGLPQTGKMTAKYVYGGGVQWAAFGGSPAGNYGASNTAATSGSSLTCFDNGGTNNATQQYSMGQNNGNGVNCSLTFQMQGAAR